DARRRRSARGARIRPRRGPGAAHPLSARPLAHAGTAHPRLRADRRHRHAVGPRPGRASAVDRLAGGLAPRPGRGAGGDAAGVLHAGAARCPMTELRDVTFRHADATAPLLHRVSWSVDEAELALVAGRTGSGKSTLLALLNGLVPQFTGG